MCTYWFRIVLRITIRNTEIASGRVWQDIKKYRNTTCVEHPVLRQNSLKRATMAKISNFCPTNIWGSYLNHGNLFQTKNISFSNFLPRYYLNWYIYVF